MSEQERECLSTIVLAYMHYYADARNRMVFTARNMGDFMKIFQVFSRNNDVNGNPYRLIIVHQTTGHEDIKMIEAVECRSSRPNYLHTLRKRGAIEISGVHLTATEYNRVKCESNRLLGSIASEY